MTFTSAPSAAFTTAAMSRSTSPHSPARRWPSETTMSSSRAPWRAARAASAALIGVAAAPRGKPTTVAT